MLALLDQLAASGHRILIFSQSRVMLDILEVWDEAQGGGRGEGRAEGSRGGMGAGCVACGDRSDG